MATWLQNRGGVAGLLAGLLLWAMSVAALTAAMRANVAASLQERMHDFGGAKGLISHLHRSAMGWGATFTLTQLLSLLVIAFTLRASYRLRTAICFISGVGFVMFGDLLGLFALLVWLGWTLGAR